MNERIYYSHEAERQAQRDRTMLALTVLLLGVGIGTAMAMLFAPQSGARTREALGSTAGQTLEGLASEVARLRRDMEDRIAHS